MSKSRILLIYGITILILLLLFVLPALQRKRYGPIPYITSMSNLKEIGIALRMYAEDNNDVFPDDLKQIYTYIMPSNKYIFDSPPKPGDFNNPSYIYISGQMMNVRKSEAIGYILAYENPEYCSEYLDDNNVPFIVLFLDGTVKRMKKDKFLSSLKATYEHLGKPMPEIKFKEQVPVNK